MKRFWVVLLLAANLDRSCSARRHIFRQIKADVTFLATSTSIRSGFGASEDVYLVELMLPHANGEATLAKLVDQFPEYRAPFTRDALTSRAGRTVLLIRDQECDEGFDK